MPSSAIERLESALDARRLAGTLAHRREKGTEGARAATGWPRFDEVLGGGWRRGEVSEVVGARSSGRTRVLVATLAAATRRGEVVALVDTFDRFDPRSAAEAGVDLDRVLWVRGAAITVEQAGRALIGTSVVRAVRALDLIVRAGGFAVAALDLVDVPPRIVRALPPSTWLRIAQANERREMAVVLCGDAPMGRSAGGVSVRLSAVSRWAGHSPQSRRLADLEISMHVVSARPAIEGWRLGA